MAAGMAGEAEDIEARVAEAAVGNPEAMEEAAVGRGADTAITDFIHKLSVFVHQGSILIFFYI